MHALGAVAEVRDRETGRRAPVRVLIVDDEPGMRRFMSRVLTTAGYEVSAACDGAEALTILETQPVDLVVSDVAMPRVDGLTLLRKLREREAELPVILIAGAPTADSAISAVRYRATEYLAKPLLREQLLDSVARSLDMDRLAALRRQAMHLRCANTNGIEPDADSLEMRFGRAMAALYMVYQPIVSWSKRSVFGYEALVRSSETSLPHPGAIFDAAETLQRVCEVGREIRSKCGDPMRNADADTSLFVNLHTHDLLDEALYDPGSKLAQWASRVVLEITERAAIDDVPDVAARMQRLRALGYRIAVDDIGAGYSGLNSFATLHPELVKLDITLVRNIDTDPVRRRLVKLLSELCVDLGIAVVAEGVETTAERDALLELGLDLFQGYLFARPGAPFPEPKW
jgi:EAL domain-containing protein (putative c-di-GMP-specific phosphodiesterase class I)